MLQPQPVGEPRLLDSCPLRDLDSVLGPTQHAAQRDRQDIVEAMALGPLDPGIGEISKGVGDVRGGRRWGRLRGAGDDGAGCVGRETMGQAWRTPWCGHTRTAPPSQRLPSIHAGRSVRNWSRLDAIALGDTSPP